MARYSSDYDPTVLHLNSKQNQRNPLPFPAVSEQAKPETNVVYVAQQSSLEDFSLGVNPLVSAATQLLLEIIKIKKHHREPIESLRARLEAEVRRFEAQAAASEIEHSHILAARYVLCTAIDESVTTSALGETGDWSRLALLSTFHNETWGGEKFFQILDRCMQQPARNLYLLELMYLLLSFGFEGRYHVLDRGAIALESLRDKIYRQVRILRGEASPDLAKRIEVKTIKDKIYAYIPTWLIGSVVLICLFVTLFGFSFALNRKADPLLTRFNALSPQQPLVISPAATEVEEEEEDVEGEGEEEPLPDAPPDATAEPQQSPAPADKTQ